MTRNIHPINKIDLNYSCLLASTRHYNLKSCISFYS